MHLTRRATWYATGILGVLLGLLAYVAVGAVTSPSVRLVSIAVGFERPSVLALVDREMLVGEQAGTVRRLDGSTWMDLSASVRAEGEMGLLGLVEHPDDGRIFVTYTALNGDTVLSSFEGNDLDSELELLRVAQDSEVHCRSADECDSTPYTAPVVEYPHDCALIGGYVYRAAPEAELFGQYIYGDYCSGRIRAVSAEGGDWRLLVDSDVAISTFGLDSEGRLYVAGIDDETIYRIDCDGCP